jgi:hypothetical protein
MTDIQSVSVSTITGAMQTCWTVILQFLSCCLFGRSRESLTLSRPSADILLHKDTRLEQACHCGFMEKVEVARHRSSNYYENQSPKATDFSVQANSSNRPRRRSATRALFGHHGCLLRPMRPGASVKRLRQPPSSRNSTSPRPSLQSPSQCHIQFVAFSR